MPASRSAPIETSYTKKVTDALALADDLLTVPQLAAVTGIPPRRVAGSLYWLKKARVVAAIEEAGKLYWYLSGDDSRSRVIEEHRREDEPRRTRKLQKTKP